MSVFRRGRCDDLVNRMKILVLANFDVGLYKFRKALLERFLKDGHEVHIALPNGEYVPRLVELGCTYIETPLERRGMNPAKDISLYHLYCSIIKQIRPDLVVTYTVKPNVYGGMACRKLKVPYAANITGLGTAIEQGGALRTLVLNMYREALKKAKVVFFENTGNRDRLVEFGAVKADKTYVLNGAGIETSDYPLAPYPPDGPVKFLFVGRIMREKGVDELFSAMTRLKQTYGDRVQLDLVGFNEESYEQKIQKLQKDGIVQFLGFQDDVPSFYRSAHCVVLPSYHEGMSNVLLEAGAMGRPLITSNIHGCMEAVEEGKSGYLCAVRDADSLLDAMSRFVELPYEEKVKMGQASHDHVVKRFDKKLVVEDTIRQLY